MEYIIENFFNLAIMKAAFPTVLAGFGMTLLLIAIVVPVGCLGGLSVALLGTSRSRALRWTTIVYVDFFRAFPPLVLLICRSRASICRPSYRSPSPFC